MHSSKMAGGIVTLVISLPCLASFTVGKEAFIRGGVDSYPHLPCFPVHPICMSLTWSAIYFKVLEVRSLYPAVNYQNVFLMAPRPFDLIDRMCRWSGAGLYLPA